ncbi:hypothetical protein ACXYMU_04895 [Pontibacter sp. CAU 1760]
MKKVMIAGVLFLSLGMASCKTYCPAYNLASVEDTTDKASSSATEKVANT